MKQTLLILFIAYLSLCTGDRIRRKKRHHTNSNKRNNKHISSAHTHANVVVSKEGPPPSPQEYTISKLEAAVVCDTRGDKTWSKWKEYDLDGVCSRLQYYGEIEGQCETDCDVLCPQGFHEVAKEPCSGADAYGGATSSLKGSGYYRQCVGRYKCTQSSYDYWVNMKWWQFLIWEVVIIILGCCFFGLAVGCCIRCYYSRRGNRGRGRGGGSGNYRGGRQPATQNQGNRENRGNQQNDNQNP
eukprot:UN01827